MTGLPSVWLLPQGRKTGELRQPGRPTTTSGRCVRCVTVVPLPQSRAPVAVLSWLNAATGGTMEAKLEADREQRGVVSQTFH
jgi:hypothetical protein